MPTVTQYVTSCPDRAVMMGCEFVRRTTRFVNEVTLLPKEGSVWAVLNNGVSIRIASMDDLLALDDFIEFLEGSDEFLLFATNGDGK